MTVAFAACRKAEPVDDGKGGTIAPKLVAPLIHCGEVGLLDVHGANGFSLGVFEIQNDSSDLWFTFSPSGGSKLEEISIFAGPLERCPFTEKGTADPTRFPIRFTQLQHPEPWTTKMSMAKLNECFFVAVSVKLSHGSDTLIGWVSDGKETTPKRGFNHCTHKCTLQDQPCDLEEGGPLPLTLTQSSWTDKFDKPYSGMLETDFSKLFPQGLSLGCNFKIRFESAKDILNLLPILGAPKVLDRSIVNPIKSQLDNQFVGELCALSLTVKFDEAFDLFSKPKVRLSQLEVATGAFADWKVEEVIQEANAVLGNCASNYTPNQLYEVLVDINRNAAQSGSKGTFLRCPQF